MGSSINRKLISAWSFIGVCTLALSAGAVFVIANQITQQQAITIKMASEDWLNSLDETITERGHDLRSLANIDAIRSMSNDRSQAVINEFMVSGSKNFDGLILIDGRGRVLAVNTVDANGKFLDTYKIFSNDFSKSAWFTKLMPEKNAQRTYEAGDSARELNALFPNVDSRSLIVSANVRDGVNGTTIGVLTGILNWKRLVETSTKEFESRYSEMMGQKVSAMIIDENSLFLLHPNGSTSELKQRWHQTIATTGGKLTSYVTTDKSLIDDESSVIMSVVPLKGALLESGIRWTGILQTPTKSFLTGSTAGLGLGALAFVLFGIVIAAAYTNRTVSKNNLSILSASSEMSHLVKNFTQLSNTLNQQMVPDEVLIDTEKFNERSPAAHLDNAFKNIERDLNALETSLKNKKNSTKYQNISTEVQTRLDSLKQLVFDIRMLAFNAAIEASKFGEQGRSFANVSEEIGKLATSTLRSCEDTTLFVQKSFNPTASKAEGLSEEDTVTVQKILRVIYASRQLIADLGHESFGTQTNRGGSTRLNSTDEIRVLLNTVGQALSRIAGEFELAQTEIEHNNATAESNTSPRISPLEELSANKTDGEAPEISPQASGIRIVKDEGGKKVA